MAASPTAVPLPKTDGGNALAALLAAAAASMHRQQQQQQQNQQQTLAPASHTEVHHQSMKRANTNNIKNNKNHNTSDCLNTQSAGNANSSSKAILNMKQGGNVKTQTIQQQLEANRDTLCQLLNLKPASLIDSSPSSTSPSPSDGQPPLTNTPLNKRSASPPQSSIHHLLSSKSRLSDSTQHNHSINEFHQSRANKSERSPVKHENGLSGAKKQNGVHKVQSTSSNSGHNTMNKDLSTGQYKRQATIKSMNNTAIASTKTTKTRNETNHKSSTSSSSSNSTFTDKDSSSATKLLVSLVSGNSKPTIETDQVELRNLESWHDEDEERLDDSCYQELVDPSNSNGWSADEMFKYNEKMHKISSSYTEKTLSDNYTTPLPKINSKTTMRLASQLAKEIEDRVLAEGRITPESSDDDELFEHERMQRVKLKQHKDLDQLKNYQHQLQRHSQNRCSNNQGFSINNVSSSKTTTTTTTTKSSSQYSNSTETPATASLSSSPTLNDTIIKPVTSSSRNILRTCLT